MSNRRQTICRLNLRISPDEQNQIKYFVATYPDKWTSANEFVRTAIENYIVFLNRDYHLPAPQQERVNQLVDAMIVLSGRVGALEEVLTSSFGELMRVTRGDNYLLDYCNGEDGEL